jgi:hypothetical protein
MRSSFSVSVEPWWNVLYKPSFSLLLVIVHCTLTGTDDLIITCTDLRVIFTALLITRVRTQNLVVILAKFNLAPTEQLFLIYTTDPDVG